MSLAKTENKVDSTKVKALCQTKRCFVSEKYSYPCEPH